MHLIHPAHRPLPRTVARLRRLAGALRRDLSGVALTEFPSHHGGFQGGEHGYAGQPAAVAARLREVLGDG